MIRALVFSLFAAAAITLGAPAQAETSLKFYGPSNHGDVLRLCHAAKTMEECRRAVGGWWYVDHLQDADDALKKRKI